VPAYLAHSVLTVAIAVAIAIVLAVIVLVLLGMLCIAIAANWEACGPMFAVLFLIVVGWVAFAIGPMLGGFFLLFLLAVFVAAILEQPGVDVWLREKFDDLRRMVRRS
jgi:hypothetical protein